METVRFFAHLEPHLHSTLLGSQEVTVRNRGGERIEETHDSLKADPTPDPQSCGNCLETLGELGVEGGPLNLPSS